MDSMEKDVPDMQPNDEYNTTLFDPIADSFIGGFAAAPARSAPKNKRKHNTLTLADKYGIILRLDQGESSAALCREFNIGRSTLYDIKTNRAEIEKFVTSQSHSLYDRKTLKKGDYPEVEEAIYSWYTEEKNHIQITGDLLKEKGKYFFNMIHKRDDFQASEGWLDKFKKRFGIRLSANSDSHQPIPADFVEPALAEVSMDCSNKFLSVVDQQKLLPDQVYVAFGGIINCTSLPVGLCLPYTPQIQTVAFMPCMNVTGKHKLALLVVGDKQSSGVINVANYVVKDHVEISAAALQEWHLEHFVPFVIKYLKKQNLPKKCLLVVTNVSSFPDEADMKIKTTDGLLDVMFLPQFSADLFQNMGQDLISILKTLYKKRLLIDFLSKPLTEINDVMQRYSMKEAVSNLAYAWQQVPSAQLAKYWLQLWPAIAYSPEFKPENGDVSDAQAEIESVINLYSLRHIPGSSTVSSDALRTWLTADFKTELDNRTWPDNQARLENPNPADVSTVSCDEAISAVNTLLQWTKEQGVGHLEVLALKKLQERVLISSFHVKNECLSPLNNF